MPVRGHFEPSFNAVSPSAAVLTRLAPVPFSIGHQLLYNGRMRKILVFTLLLTAAAQAADHAVVFMYHRFGEAQYPSTNVTREQFAAHLEHLADNGYQVWPLARIVTHFQEGRPLPDKVVAITVDDAYRSVYEVAYPLLKARGWPFTVFVSTGPVDRGLGGYLSWDEMREMQRHGASFANHTVSHAYLLNREPEESEADWLRRVQREIVHAQARLQAELGEDVNEAPRLFAWPYGEYDLRLAGLLRTMGYVGFGQQSGVAWRHGDMFAQPRYPVAEAYADLEEFALKSRSLPLPVAEAEPRDPTALRESNPPRLRLRLREGAARPAGLACYIQGVRVEPLWRDGRLVVQAPAPLEGRRSRYNCTAPAAAGRYYWYSHLWIDPGRR